MLLGAFCLVSLIFRLDPVYSALLRRNHLCLDPNPKQFSRPPRKRCGRASNAVGGLLGGFLFCSSALAQQPPSGPAAAVVRIPSHGCSATVIHTQPGWSLLLTCAHAFESPAEKRKRIVIECPWPVQSADKSPARNLLWVDSRADVALVELGDGPLPYVCRVAPAGFRASLSVSVGYDEMKWPAKQRQAHALTASLLTTERPWHGRSGGALIDQRTGYLVGVVSGYSGPRTKQEIVRGANGIYAGPEEIVAAIRSWASAAGVDPSPVLGETSGPQAAPGADPFAQPIVRRPAPQAAPQVHRGPMMGLPSPT